MSLTYRALDKNGRRVRNVIDSNDMKEAMESLRRQGLFVTRIEPSPAEPTPRSTKRRAAKSNAPGPPSSADSHTLARSAESKAEPAAGRPSGLLNWWQKVSATGQASQANPSLSLKVLLLFTRQLHMLLGSGSAVVPALQAIHRQMKKPRHAAIVESIIYDLESGQPLSQALRRHPKTFDPSYISIIAAGEASASLDKSLERLARTMSRRKALQNKVIGATAYPALLILMSVGILLVMLFFIIPRFGTMLTGLGVPLPASTRIMLSVAGVLSAYWPACVLAAVAVAAAVGIVLKTVMGRRWLSDIQTQLPIIGGLASRLIQANFFRTMGALLESGVGLLDALELTRKLTTNRRFGQMFDDMQHSITSGKPMSESVEASGLVAPSFCQAIRTGEESGSIGPAMTFAADVLDEENTAMVDTLTKLIEPIILIAMGAMIAGVAVSLFVPMFDLTTAVRG